MEHVHIVPVNLPDWNRILKGFSEYKVNKVYLIEGPDKKTDEIFKSVIAQEKLKQHLRNGGIPFEEVRVDVVDFESCFEKISKIVYSEISKKNKVYFNISGATHIPFSVIFNIASFFDNSTIYYVVPDKYEPAYRETKGFKKVIELPANKIQKIPLIQVKILQALRSEKNREVNSHKALILIMARDTKVTPALLSYHIQELKKKTYIETKKQGLETRISLTLNGFMNAYLQGELGEMKKDD